MKLRPPGRRWLLAQPVWIAMAMSAVDLVIVLYGIAYRDWIAAGTYFAACLYLTPIDNRLRRWLLTGRLPPREPHP